MASRHKFWVIIVGNAPTAFRANYKEELLPTLTQLRRTQSEVSIRWFARGRLWDSPIEEHAALKTTRSAPRARAGDWRPGGAHKDPNARYEMTRDEKRARFKKRLSGPPRPFRGKPAGPKRRP
jgi:hypothetical protein